jgi:3-dehydrosphinganine reductase
MSKSEELKESLERLEPVFLLINCAGISISGTFEDTSIKDFHKMMSINYFGSVNMAKCLLPQMKASTAQGKGIVFVSSIAGLLGLFGYTAYSASKFAVRGFAEVLEMELKPFGIDVTVYCPPDTKTPGYEEEQKSKPRETQLISEAGGLVEAKDVAEDLLDKALKSQFLCSYGFDGYLSTVMCIGMANSGFFEMLLQAVLATPLRVVPWCYRQYFNYIVSKVNKERESPTSSS